SYMDWPDRIETCATVAETDELGKMLAEAIQKEVGVKSKVLKPGQYNETVKYDALFVPVQLVNDFRDFAKDGRLLPIIFHIDADTLLSIVDQAALDTIGLVTAQEQTIPKLINALKTNINFEGSFVAGATSNKTLPMFVRET